MSSTEKKASVTELSITLNWQKAKVARARKYNKFLKKQEKLLLEEQLKLTKELNAKISSLNAEQLEKYYEYKKEYDKGM